MIIGEAQIEPVPSKQLSCQRNKAEPKVMSERINQLKSEYVNGLEEYIIELEQANAILQNDLKELQDDLAARQDGVAYPKTDMQAVCAFTAYLAQGKKINAITKFRALTDCGLKEAKDSVENCFFNIAEHWVVKDGNDVVGVFTTESAARDFIDRSLVSNYMYIRHFRNAEEL